MKKELLLSLTTICIVAMLSGCGESKNKNERTRISSNTVISDQTDIDINVDTNNQDDHYDIAETGAWNTNTCHNDKYKVTVNSKTKGHPSGKAMSSNYYYKRRTMGDFIEDMDIQVKIIFCNDNLLDIHPDYQDYTAVNCFGLDGYYKEIQNDDYYEFLSERESQNVDGRNGIAIYFPCYDDMYLVAVIEYFSFFENMNEDDYKFYYEENGIIYDGNNNPCEEYEAYDLKELFTDPEFLEFDEIEVSEL